MGTVLLFALPAAPSRAQRAEIAPTSPLPNAAPADIGAAPRSFDESLFTGGSVTRMLGISNSGGSDLHWQIEFTPSVGGTLADTLAGLDLNFGEVTAAIPRIFLFSEGVTGNSIVDGGSDMFDGGNRLATNRGSAIPYSDGVVATSSIVGPTGSYFTRKYPGLWVFAADLDGVSSFSITGNVGADGFGNVDGTVLHAESYGIRYTGFVKRIYNAFDPSVNHLVVVEDRPGINHDFPANTDNDFHRVTGLTGTRRLYYLLYAGDRGSYIDDAATQRIFDAFVQFLVPGWLSTTPRSGVVPAGQTTELPLRFDATGLAGGDYAATILLHSDDPDEAELALPAHLHVTDAPDVQLSATRIDFGSVFTATTHSRTLSVKNAGVLPLVVSDVASSDPAFGADPASFTLAPGETRSLTVSFDPPTDGSFDATLTVHSNDPDEAALPVALHAVALVPPDVDASPSSFEQSLFSGGNATYTLTIDNDGGSDLVFRTRLRGAPGPARILVLATTPFANSVGRALDELGRTYDALSTDEFTGVNFAPYDVIVAALDGGDVDEDDVAALAAAVADGRLVVILGGTNFQPYIAGVNSSLLTVTAGGWVLSGEPHLSVVDPADPLAAGLPATTTFVNRTAAYYLLRINDPAAEVVAANGDGFAALVRKSIGAGRLVYFINTPRDANWTAPQDFPILRTVLANALTQVPWLAVTPAAGVVPAGETAELAVTFDATHRFGGDYAATILLQSNDPDEPQLELPALLHVTGAPDIAVAPPSLDFALVYTGTSRELTLTVANAGTEPLSVSGVSTDHPAFSVEATGFTLGIGESRPLHVSFTPPAAGSFDATLTVSSDDPDEPLVAVPLAATSLVPPDIAVAPSAFDESALAGESLTRTLTISNTGSSDLAFTLALSNGLIPAPSRIAEPHGPAAPSAVGRSQPVEPSDGSRRAGEAPTAPQPRRLAGAKVAIVEEYYPWDVDSNERVLAANGIPYDVISVFDLPFIQLNDYRMVLVPSDQPTYFYELLQERASQLESFVAGGGVLEFHAAGWGFQDGDASLVVLPGGMRIVQSSTTVNRVVLPGHPLVAGVPQVFSGSSASHAYFAEIPAAAARIVEDDLGHTNLVVYPFGSGWVISGGQTFEYGYAFGESAGTILANMFPFAYTIAPPWLDVEPHSGLVAPGQSAEIAVTFDATALIGGEYTATILVQSNDPDEAQLGVPVRLHVTGVADLALDATSLEFGEVFNGTARQRTVEVRNTGTDVLVVNAVTTDDPRFTIDPSSFTLAVGASRVVTVSFAPTVAGDYAATLTLASNDPDGPATVHLHGQALIPPDVAVSPAAFAETLAAGQAVTRTLTISNGGGSHLDWQLDLGQNGTSLEELLAAFDENYSLVTAAIPNPFDFAEGVTGALIGDGGDDMYDGGNLLNTDLGFAFPYSDGVVRTHPAVGPAGRYFTRKYPGLFVLVADLDGVSSFSISGNLGADGGGNVDGTVLQADSFGTRYRGFVKRVYHAFDPSVNHLIIVADSPTLAHTFPSNTNDDMHEVTGLGGTHRLYYLLYAGQFGGYIDDAATQAIFEAFVERLSPRWLAADRTAGVVEVGTAQQVALTLDASTLTPGQYDATLHLRSNDPDESDVSLPVQLNVVPPEPILTVAPQALTEELFPGQSSTRSLTLANPGNAPLVFQVAIASGGATANRFFDTMEFGENGWTQQLIDGTMDALWHQTHSQSASPTTSWWCGAETEGSYDASRRIATSLVSPPIHLEGSGTPVTLLFHERYVTEVTWDQCMVDISVDDGASWIPLRGAYGSAPSGDSGGWIETSLDLSPYADQTVRIRFYFDTYDEFNNDFPGWFVDDVSVVTPGAGWLTTDPGQGAIAPGQSRELLVNINASTLPLGDYDGLLQFTSNDVNQPVQLLPVLLHVVEPPQITAGSPSVDFGSVFVGTTREVTLQLGNSGQGTLQVLSIASTNSDVTSETTTLSIAAGGTAAVNLRYTPTAVGPLTGTLAIASNDPTVPVLGLPLSGQALLPPVAEVAPAAIETALPPLSTTVTQLKTLSIHNAGASELTWSVEPASATPWLSLQPASGAIAPNGSAEVTLTFSSTALATGDYAATVLVHSNDPFRDRLEVSVLLHVSEITLESFEVDLRPKPGTGDIEAALQLPAGWDPRDIVIASVRLWGELPAEPTPIQFVDRNGDGRSELLLTFDGREFEKRVGSGQVTAVVTGEVRDRTWFRGVDELRVQAPRVSFPNGGEFLLIGNTVTIAWTPSTSTNHPRYDVLSSRDGGQSWNPLATGLLQTSYAWTVSEEPTGHALVRVVASEATTPLGHDTSDAEFVIQRSLLAPAAVTTLRLGRGAGSHGVLGWQPPAVDLDHGPAVSYRVLRASAPQGPFTQIGTTAATAFTEGDPSAPVWFYKIVAVNSVGEGPD
ncbi:MAG TPA: choice-of-anchor D domain-containing protein [Candidatus Polarisedimenticolaceae bacterium]|nr:choice-of-anchor D domain-containing protein [Candidatus Polarisedimenticolaceae bacterium]